MTIPRLTLLALMLAGCSAGFQTVPVDQWRTVPVAQRDAIDRTADATAIAADSELKSATAAVQAARSAVRASVPHHASADPAIADHDWALAVHDHEQSKRAMEVEVERAKAAWQRADLTWKVQRLDSATAHLEVVRCEREYDRARAVDHQLLGDDVYEDVAMFRGQLARAQERWFALTSGAAHARGALEDASAKVASVKEAYAQLMRSGPPIPPSMQDDRDRWQLGGGMLAAELHRRMHSVPAPVPTHLLVGGELGRRYELKTASLVGR